MLTLFARVLRSAPATKELSDASSRSRARLESAGRGADIRTAVLTEAEAAEMKMWGEGG